MKRLPFRWRLTLWSTIVAAVSIIICGLVAAWFVRQREILELDAELRAESAHFFEELDRHGSINFDWRKIGPEVNEWLPPENPPRFMEIRTGQDVRWRSTNADTPAAATQDVGSSGTHMGDRTARLLRTERGGVTFIIGAELDQARAMAGTLALSFLAGLPLALAFAWFGGRKLASFAVSPVEEMTTAIERVTAERLDQRVPVPPVADEIQRHARVLNSTLDRLERSYKQALRFSADASHELKTPLTVMRASIEAVLESETLPESDHIAIAGLLDETRRLSNITASLLLLARADAGRLTLDKAEHDLAAITEGCAEDARIVAGNRGVRVECQLPDRALAYVDALRFSQILSNLLDNAVKYNRDGGTVRVNLTEEAAGWKLLVANTGPGIPVENRTLLFERFFRVEHASEQPGSGLGLSLARELAIAHGGNVQLIRSDDDWTEFVVTLPRLNGKEAT